MMTSSETISIYRIKPNLKNQLKQKKSHVVFSFHLPCWPHETEMLSSKTKCWTRFSAPNIQDISLSSHLSMERDSVRDASRTALEIGSLSARPEHLAQSSSAFVRLLAKSRRGSIGRRTQLGAAVCTQTCHEETALTENNILPKGSFRVLAVQD